MGQVTMGASSLISSSALGVTTVFTTKTPSSSPSRHKTQIETRTRIRHIVSRLDSDQDPIRCCPCGRRHLIGSGSSAAATLLLPSNLKADIIMTSVVSQLPTEVSINKFHPQRPDWYEEFYAQALDQGMRSYEAQIAGYKKELFGHLTGKSKDVVELGVGTGPNFKYYARDSDHNVIGLDPNEKMEKYARAAAIAAGLPPANFTFIRGVAEALPLGDNSMDAVIGTLMLCSVKDVNIALKEVRRVLKSGGLYLFIEHVAARDETLLRLMQSLLDPLQQFVSDGCHLTRETGRHISEVGFSSALLPTLRNNLISDVVLSSCVLSKIFTWHKEHSSFSRNFQPPLFNCTRSK